MFHAHTESLTRLLMAITFAVVGVAAFAWPRCMAGVAGFFAGCSPALPPADRERLSRVIAAREDAEGISAAYGRYLGVMAFACAALEAVWAIPFIVPYAIFCLAGAGVMVLAYVQFRRAADQRVAPLVRRSPFAALPPVVIAAMACSLCVSLALAADPAERFGALAVAACTVVLGIVAWRVANGPALLIGSDPQWEYVVDERVRVGRARTIANLACTPAFVLAGMAELTLSPQYASLGSVAFYVAGAAFFVSFFAAIVPLTRRIRPA